MIGVIENSRYGVGSDANDVGYMRKNYESVVLSHPLYRNTLIYKKKFRGV